jgi:hypothetical protein
VGNVEVKLAVPTIRVSVGRFHPWAHLKKSVRRSPTGDSAHRSHHVTFRYLAMARVFGTKCYRTEPFTEYPSGAGTPRSFGDHLKPSA